MRGAKTSKARHIGTLISSSQQSAPAAGRRRIALRRAVCGAYLRFSNSDHVASKAGENGGGGCCMRASLHAAA
jgi:hypothetical protein